MKRTTAREIAVQLGFYAAQTGKSVADIAEEFFDKDYYSTLAEVDELYAEYPEKKQISHIEGLPYPFRMKIRLHQKNARHHCQ